jgi:hypothetical protein
MKPLALARGHSTAVLVLVLLGCGANDRGPQSQGAGGAGGSQATMSGGNAGSAPQRPPTAGAAGIFNGGGAGAGQGGSAGESSLAGSAGEGRMPPSQSPPVDCNNLSDEVGVWKNISPLILLDPPNMEVYSVAVNPTDGTVFMAGGNNTNSGACPQNVECPLVLTGLMRSSDCGATFTRINTIEADTPGAKLMTGALWAMVLDPQDPNIMYVANGYGNDPTIYKSSNAGVDWRQLSADPDGQLNFVQAIAVSPYDGQHLAITWHDTCKAPRKPFCLSTSKDGGETWMLFDGPSSIPNWEITGWLEASAISILGPTSYLLTTPAGVWYSGDTGGSWFQVAAETVYASYSGSSVIAGGDLYIAGAGHILWSPGTPGSDPPFAVGTSHTVMPLEGSPTVTALVTDGKSLFVGSSREGEHQLWSAALADTGTWTQTTDTICNAAVCRGPNAMAYDPVHHVVYAANWATGLWRYVVE